MKPTRIVWLSCTVVGLAAASIGAVAYSPQQPGELPLIRRTEFSVPHILARDFRAAGIGLGYTQVEDYGDRVILSLLRNKGWMGRTFGHDSINSDFAARLDQARVEETFHLLDADTRAMYDGFAEGVNVFIRAHGDKVGKWAKPVFNGHDVAAGDIGNVGIAAAQRMVLRSLAADSARQAGGRPPARQSNNDPLSPAYSEDGSNAWALAPSRTKSGNAILLRNPHLAWTAGYWEAHVTVPGKLDFYGDFRIGSAFAVVGGFNADLGWATTNNNPQLQEVYELDADPNTLDHYLFDGASVAIRTTNLVAQFLTPDGLKTESRPYETTPLGPVVHRTKARVYVVRGGSDGEYRAGAQFLRMMRARNYKEWQSALAIRARATSNLTYADRAGNIHLIWMASIPSLPIASGGDTLPVPARRSSDIWSHLVPLESLPQVLNPTGGYVMNSNNPPWYPALDAILDTAKYPAYFERPDLGLRPQLALQLVGGTNKFSLEESVKLKHSMRMLLADRVKPDLLAAVRATKPDSESARAVLVLERWNNTVAPESKGSLLFETWWRRYSTLARDSAFAEKWSAAKLTSTPRGLGKPALAVDAFSWALGEMKRRYGSVDVAWGDVHRVRVGPVDVPVGGCSGALGCFRVLGYQTLPDNKRIANTGDGWILAVEFGKQGPRAYSVLAYGQSADTTSAFHSDQAAMFARGELKPVWLSEKDIKAHTISEYRPGRP